MTRHLVLLLLTLAIAGCASPRPRVNTRQVEQNAKNARDAVRLSADGDNATDDGDLALAEKRYREAIALDPSLSASWNNLGVVLMKRENYIDAVEVFNVAAELMPGDPRPPTNAGLAYQQAGFDADALRNFEEALRRDPRWIDALRGAVTCNMRLLTYNEKALDLTRRALLIERDDEWRAIFERERIRIENALDRQRSE